MYKRARRKRKRKRTQKGGLLCLTAILPFAKAALPFLRKEALGGAASFSGFSVLGKIFGGGRKKPYVQGKRFYLGGKKPYAKGKRLYLGGRKPYTRESRLYLGGRKKQQGGFLPFSPPFWIVKKIVKSAIKR